MGKYGKIAVLCGGPSTEREISLASGRAVAAALKRRGESAELLELGYHLYDEVRSVNADVVFIALHGKFGEDGTVQEILEGMEIPYTGSGAHASRLALDKIASRELFFKNGLAVPNYRIIEKETGADPENFDPPFVVKPPLEGSSIGLTVVRAKKDSKSAFDKAWQYANAILLEEYIKGRELTVGIFEEAALPVIEIFTKRNVYDFEAKYTDPQTRYRVPAALEKSEHEDAVSAALAAYRILGCRDFARVDMRMDEKGAMRILEVNTIPGMTERSLLPKAAKARGIEFEDLCLRLLALAHGRKEYTKENRNEKKASAEK